MLAKFGTNSGGITWCSNFEPNKWNHIQLAKFGTNASDIPFSWRDNQVKESIPWVPCASGNVLKTLVISGAQGTKSPIDLFWTAKKKILDIYILAKMLKIYKNGLHWTSSSTSSLQELLSELIMICTGCQSCTGD